MCKKKDAGFWVGMGLVGVGVAIGAYAAKKYIDRRRKLIKNYNIEVDRLQNEVDFDYSEEFLDELKKDTLRADRKQISKDDIKKVVKENTDAVKVQVAKLESVLKEHLKRSGEKSADDAADVNTDDDRHVVVDVKTKEAIAEDSDFETEDE